MWTSPVLRCSGYIAVIDSAAASVIKGYHSRHAAINDIIKRSLGAVNIQHNLEQTGPYCLDGKCPDGAIVQWKGGKVLVWDATCPHTLAPSYTNFVTRELKQEQYMAEEAERKKKGQVLPPWSQSPFCACGYMLITGGLGPEARSFFWKLCWRLMDSSSKPLSHFYLLQKVAVAIQHGNTEAILGSSNSDIFSSLWSALVVFNYWFFHRLFLLLLVLGGFFFYLLYCISYS